jgi:thiol-disulfide isomerase/thioredoxin
MTIHGYAKRLSAALIVLLLLLTAAACSPSDGGLETYPSDGGSVALPTDTASDGDTSSDGDASSEGETSVNTAPDFAILDMDGKEVRLSDFFGTPIVLNFWASWCPPCKAELPDFEAACKKYEGKVTFLMVNLTDGQRETVEVAKDFVASQGYTFPVYFDTKYEAAYAYGVSSIPQTYFINADGSPEARATGMISAAQLEQGIGMIYGE